MPQLSQGDSDMSGVQISRSTLSLRATGFKMSSLLRIQPSLQSLCYGVQVWKWTMNCDFLLGWQSSALWSFMLDLFCYYKLRSTIVGYTSLWPLGCCVLLTISIVLCNFGSLSRNSAILSHYNDCKFLASGGYVLLPSSGWFFGSIISFAISKPMYITTFFGQNWRSGESPLNILMKQLPLSPLHSYGLRNSVSLRHSCRTWSSGSSSNLTWYIYFWMLNSLIPLFPFSTVWMIILAFQLSLEGAITFSMLLGTIPVENSHNLLGSFPGNIRIESSRVNRFFCSSWSNTLRINLYTYSSGSS